MRSERTFHLCGEGDLSEGLRQHLAKMATKVEREPEDYILSTDEDAYIGHVVSEFELDNIVLDESGLHAEDGEEQIPAQYFPFNFNVRKGGSYPRPVYTYRLPFGGDAGLLRLRPSRFSTSEAVVFVRDSHICFKLIDFEDMERVKRDGDSTVRSIVQQVERLRQDVADFNDNQLPQAVRDAVLARKARVSKRHEKTSALGIPIVKKGDAASTFSVPAAKKKKQVLTRPQPGQHPVALTPTIADAVYQDILTTLGAVGRQIERTPSAYEGKGEEALRDLFLLPLEANFEGAATGETFNKSGKTDILLRHDGHNLFVAECKFWGGAETLRKAIDQLLGYLTFRDSKAALLVFVKNKGLSAVLGQIEEVLHEHPQFISIDAKPGDSDWRATFSLPGDPGLHVQVAVLLLHTPTP